LGWTGIVLLSAAFGLAMPGLVDLSLFTEHDRDIAYWTDMRQAILVEPLGISVYSAISWVSGHILMSIGAPLALLDALAPHQAIAIRRYATIRHWSSREIGALAAGAVIGRCVIGFLSPVTDGAGLAAKLAQNTILVSAALALTWLVTRRTEQGPTNATPGPGRAATSTTE
jgi:hypothetical protein